MDHRSLAELLEHLGGESRVWIRLAACRPDTDWQLSLLEITTGAPPASWRRARWQYRWAAFVGSAPAGKTVARWLENGRVSLPAVSCALNVSDPIYVEWRESRARGVYEAVDWPTRTWTVQRGGDPFNVPQQELVAGGAPAFVSFDQAAAAFFGLPPSPNRGYSGRELVVRDQDPRGRIDSVRVRPTEIVASASGTAIAGAQLTLGGHGAPRQELSARSREVHLPLTDGLPVGAWLALHRGNELLDRRILDPSWGGWDFDVEVDPETQVDALISDGEGLSTEFKAKVPESSPDTAMKTVAAFANGGGGSLIFGVDDDGQVVGLEGSFSRDDADRLTNLITERVRPLVDFDLQIVDYEDRKIILVDVRSGGQPPYGVGTTDRKIAYYVRRGATTFPAAPADLNVMVRSRIPPPSAQPSGPLGRRERRRVRLS